MNPEDRNVAREVGYTLGIFAMVVMLGVAIFPEFHISADACANFSGGPSPCTDAYLERRALANGFDFCQSGELDGYRTGGITCFDFPPKFEGRCESMEPVKTLFDDGCFTHYYQSDSPW